MTTEYCSEKKKKQIRTKYKGGSGSEFLGKERRMCS